MIDPSKVPTVMTAAVLLAHGGPSQLQIKHHVTVPTPLHNEVMIQVAACSINNTDINTRLGWYHHSVQQGTPTATTCQSGFDTVTQASNATWNGSRMQFPRIQGADIVGYVVRVGDNVPDHWLGSRVIVDPCLRFTTAHGNPYDDYGYIGSERDGGFAQFATAPINNCFRISSGCPWNDQQLATIPCAYGTAENMLDKGSVTKDHVVLITGASGGVGAAAVKLAKRRGAVVVGVTSKREEVLDLGADAVVGRDGDWSQVLEPIGGVDVALDVVGGGMFAKVFDVLKRGGTYVVSGAIAGKRVEVDLSMLYLRDWRMIGCTLTSREMFQRLIGYVEKGEIRPGKIHTFDLERIAEAQDEFGSKEFAGKIVVVPPPVTFQS